MGTYRNGRLVFHPQIGGDPIPFTQEELDEAYGEGVVDAINLDDALVEP